MKKLILILIAVLPVAFYGQNYENICTPGITFYSSPSSSFGAFRQDSINPAGTNDTIFISYRAIREVSDTGCLDTTSGSVLGRKIYKTASGWFYFFNRDGDTVKINSQASLSQTWKFCILPAHAYILATVTSIITDTILGTTDNVKVITLQAKDESGNNINHLLNQKFIKLSQHHGLSRMLDVYWIPNDTNFYTLAGKSTPPMGLQNLTWQEIYNFNVGDEFHYSGEGTASGWKTINKILTHTDVGNDSVVYTIEQCQQNFSGIYPYYSTTHDTITQGYGYHPASGSWITRMPGEFAPINYRYADEYWFEEHSFPGRRLKGFAEGGFFSDIIYYGNPCWMINNGYELIFISWTYAEGLGVTSRHYQYLDPPYAEHMDEYLVYYKKGSETWGTPIAPDCTVLLGNEQNKISPEAYSIEVVPNPVVDKAQIILHGLSVPDYHRYVLYNSSGIMINQGNIYNSTFIIDRQGLPSGLYILLILGDDGMIKAKTRIMVY